MSEKPKKTRKWPWVVTFACFVLYPLSIGPAYWIHEHTGCGYAFVTIFYAPITWFGFEVCPYSVGGLLFWYLSLWIKMRV
jgi:hypothetical protein